MSNPLFKKKPMDVLLSEAAETGDHTLKRTLGPCSLTALGVGAVIGAGIFVMAGLGAHYAGPGLMLSFVLAGPRLRFRGPLLRRIRGHDSARRQRLHLRVRHAGRAFRLDHRLGSDARICHGRQHGLLRLVQPLHRAAEYLPPENSSLAGLRSLDRLRTAESFIARQMASRDASLARRARRLSSRRWRITGARPRPT